MFFLWSGLGGGQQQKNEEKLQGAGLSAAGRRVVLDEPALRAVFRLGGDGANGGATSDASEGSSEGHVGVCDRVLERFGGNFQVMQTMIVSPHQSNLWEIRGH